jgi:hypothetical protein
VRSETEIILKLDKPEKARKGMEFIVYEEGDAIKDSIGQVIGKLELQKAQVRLTHVQTEFSAAESLERVWVWNGPPGMEPDDHAAERWDEFITDEFYTSRPKRIAAFPVSTSGETQSSTISGVVTEATSIAELVRSKLKNRLVIPGDLARSIAPVE